MKAVLIMGSTSDQPHADKITSTLDTLGVEHEVHAASAHKNPEKVLEIIRSFGENDAVVFVTIAGRSNALSGFVGANCNKPTIACPPFKDKVDMSINIHSTLQMPSKTPVLTVQIGRAHGLNSSHITISYAVFCLKKKKYKIIINLKHKKLLNRAIQNIFYSIGQ